ncbi:Coiled-coil domain-containing protein 16 [Metarhizium rileyi]|uniref:Coiled-coil domain-containing protein 16 n=1 Tax=Metarhizium rileyi (strain RCEF 4871) TaxID=1649241 RepID=A0A167KC45_METRR|nr:Coiled-coil domain-containing protein 16 [Metarhizium rileyi RCEF 4871]
MTDVRSLLRQQKASRRIDHPYAAYSGAGKLLCTLCREQLKAESQWDSHLLSQGHKRRMPQKNQTNSAVESALDAAPLHKRKLSPADERDEDMEDTVRSKRSKPGIAPLTGIAFNGTPAAVAAAQDNATKQGSTNTPDQIHSAGSNNSKESTKTPPSLIRRLSTTPSQGVELQIPSRPATPAHREGGPASSASAPGGYFAIQSQANSTTPLHHNASSANTTGPAPTAGKKGPTAPQVNESEWAAFEADIAAAEIPYDEGTVISAPAMTTEQVAAKEAADAVRKAQVDVDIEDEKEDATRALEDEFAEMKELEARVQSLKQKRKEMLKMRRESRSQEMPAQASLTAGSESHIVVGAAVSENDDDDDDDDEEEGDDWDGFRFRT